MACATATPTCRDPTQGGSFKHLTRPTIKIMTNCKCCGAKLPPLTLSDLSTISREEAKALEKDGLKCMAGPYLTDERPMLDRVLRDLKASDIPWVLVSNCTQRGGEGSIDIYRYGMPQPFSKQATSWL